MKVAVVSLLALGEHVVARQRGWLEAVEVVWWVVTGDVALLRSM